MLKLARFMIRKVCIEYEEKLLAVCDELLLSNEVHITDDMRKFINAHVLLASGNSYFSSNCPR